MPKKGYRQKLRDAWQRRKDKPLVVTKRAFELVR